MVTYVCPMCEMKLPHAADYKLHVHGYTKRGSRFPPKCKIGKAKFWGTDKQALEMTQAISQDSDPAVKTKYIETIRRSRQPPESLEPTFKLLSRTEIHELSEADKEEYATQVTDELLEWRGGKQRQRVKSGKPDSEVYIRYKSGTNPLTKIYVGSSKTVYENYRTRKAVHDGTAKMVKRVSGDDANIGEERHIVILDRLTEEAARTGEFEIYWSLHPDRKANAPKTSPPQYLPFIYDDNTGEWRQATHAEMREMWCFLLIDKLREMGLHEDKATLNTSNMAEALDTSNEESGGDEPKAKRVRLDLD